MNQPNAARELKAQGDSAYRQGQFAQAVAHYTDAIKADSTNPTVLTNRAMALLKLERFTDAVDSCTQALRIDATNVKALWRRGTAYYKLGQLAKAQCDFAAGLAIEPANAVLAAELDKSVKAIEAAAGIPQPKLSINAALEPVAEPRSPQDFERAWREHARVPARLYEYLKLIPTDKLPALFRASLEAGHVVDTASALEHGVQLHADLELVDRVLSTLPQIDRFSLALLFLDPSEKERIRSLLRQLAASKNLDMSPLAAKYS
ncbi:hypothetical protein LPJ63_003351 [Coemansia sp. RSA 2711]|nr:hypothetical protein LPJ63_003351 [Coemansia sp. RSA 2711]